MTQFDAAGQRFPGRRNSSPRRVFITGTHTGIGHGLAQAYLERGWEVFGTSRRCPDDLTRHDGFSFEAMDLAQPDEVNSGLPRLLDSVDHLDLVVLNAGVLGQFGDMADIGLDDLRRTMEVNVWANKSVLDRLFDLDVVIDQVVSISSGAAVNGNRGWAGYSISKSALNMLTMLYARERMDIHFCALAPGLVDTPIQEELAAIKNDGRFEALESLRKRRGTPDMPTPTVAAEWLIKVIDVIPKLVPSGDYADVRDDRFQSAHSGC